MDEFRGAVAIRKGQIQNGPNQSLLLSGKKKPSHIGHHRQFHFAKNLIDTIRTGIVCVRIASP